MKLRFEKVLKLCEEVGCNNATTQNVLKELNELSDLFPWLIQWDVNAERGVEYVNLTLEEVDLEKNLCVGFSFSNESRDSGIWFVMVKGRGLNSKFHSGSSSFSKLDRNSLVEILKKVESYA